MQLDAHTHGENGYRRYTLLKADALVIQFFLGAELQDDELSQASAELEHICQSSRIPGFWDDLPPATHFGPIPGKHKLDKRQQFQPLLFHQGHP